MPISLRVESDYPGSGNIYYAKMLSEEEYSEEFEIPTHALNINFVAGEPPTANVSFVLFKEDIVFKVLEIVEASALVTYCPFCKGRLAKELIRSESNWWRVVWSCECEPTPDEMVETEREASEVPA